MAAHVLILPGWQNSGPGHWQRLWQARFGATWVEQHDWMRPLRGDWVARLQEVVLDSPTPLVLVAHSLGCHLVAAWAAHSRSTARVRAALLVAPPDLAQESLRSVLPSWSPPVLQALPFRSTLLASDNDPYCSPNRASQFADAWGAQQHTLHNAGHINADSGLGDWPQGQAWLQQLMTPP